jgi:hypothetical protein
MDNGTAEYTFINHFFNPGVADAGSPSFLSPRSPVFNEDLSSEFGGFNFSKARTGNDTSISPTTTAQSSKDHATLIEKVWQQIMEPTLEYCRVFRIIDSLPTPS